MSASIERRPFGDRGLATYGEPLNDTYRDRAPSIGSTVTVSDSSSAEAPSCWLSVDGEAHLTGAARPSVGISHGVAPGHIAAHLDVEKARGLRDRLDAFIASVEDDL